MFLFNISDSNTNWFYLIGICWASISIPLRINWTKALTGWINWLCCNNGARFDQTNSIQSPSHEKSSRRGKKSGGRNNKIDEADVNQTENLKWIVKETLRLRFPVMITRATSASAKLKGYGIPPNTKIFMNSWAVQRDPKFWNNSEEFIPERFARLA